MWSHRTSHLPSRHEGMQIRLHCNVVEGHEPAIELLVGRGASMEARTSATRRPCTLPCPREGHAKSRFFAIAEQISVRRSNSMGHCNMTRLRRNNEEVIRLLFESGAALHGAGTDSERRCEKQPRETTTKRWWSSSSTSKPISRSLTISCVHHPPRTWIDRSARSRRSWNVA